MPARITALCITLTVALLAPAAAGQAKPVLPDQAIELQIAPPAPQVIRESVAQVAERARQTAELVTIQANLEPPERRMALPAEMQRELPRYMVVYKTLEEFNPTPRFLRDPRCSPVPEPASIAVLALGVAALALKLRKRQ